MSRLHPIPYGAGVLLVSLPDDVAPPSRFDDRVVRPTRRRRSTRRV